MRDDYAGGLPRRPGPWLTAGECLDLESRWLAALMAYKAVMEPARDAMREALAQAVAAGQGVPDGETEAYLDRQIEAAKSFRQAFAAEPDMDACLRRRAQ